MTWVVPALYLGGGGVLEFLLTFELFLIHMVK